MKNFIKKYYFNLEFFRFFVVGFICAVSHWLARIVINYYLSFEWSLIISYVAALSLAFLLNKYYVFQKSEWSISQIYKFVGINLFFLPVVFYSSILINNILNDMNYYFFSRGIAHFISISIPMMLTFVFYKFRIFIK
jgi:putative flippase GtrA